MTRQFNQQETWTSEYCRQQVDEALGEKFDYNIISMTFWSCKAEAAETYRSPTHPGAFLVGDAAHVFSPTGGLGINTGCADAQNLIWKMTAVENGWAKSHVLDTYGLERRPVAIANGFFSTANWINMVRLSRELYGHDLKNPEDPEIRMKDPVSRQSITSGIEANFDHFQ